MRYCSLFNNESINEKEIPVLAYEEFLEENVNLLKGHPERHCINYFGLKDDDKIKLYCCIADDYTHAIYVNATRIKADEKIPSLTFRHHNFEKFECEIAENFGIRYIDHPWLKPLRISHNRADLSKTIANYPFFKSESEELHEVGVGPIHAGIIEPGHFRFTCNGEEILHLEIQLGYQHRGIEDLFLKKNKLLERATLAENIAGDTTIGHATAFANLWESLCHVETTEELHFSRTLALELERIAMHTGDLAAISADIAYQLGNAVFGRLRTPIVNFFQEWGGNRLAKGLIRPGKINYPFSSGLQKKLLAIFTDYERDFYEMAELFFNLPSVLARLEHTGIVNYKQVLEIGAVGMSARMSNLERDIRKTHPFNLFKNIITHIPVMKTQGDVFARAHLRYEEISQSISYCKKLLENFSSFGQPEAIQLVPEKEKFCIALTEGWRGEICHCAITDKQGHLKIYKIKDPSFHNWKALELAVRNNEISDFPLCNKSFNLSYCGHDL